MFYHHHRSSPVSTSTYTHRLGTSSAPLTDTFSTLFPRFGDVFGTLRFTSVSIFTTTRPPTYLSLTATVSGTLLPSQTTTRTRWRGPRVPREVLSWSQARTMRWNDAKSNDNRSIYETRLSTGSHVTHHVI